MNKEGFTWKPYTVKTTDGWNLTLFRLTGRIKNVGQKQTVNHDIPVLIQHGSGMDAQTWAEWNIGETVWPLQLVDRGYDVWMTNGRGTAYGNHNDKDGSWSEAERWEFSWAEMGKYDQPAFIDKIISVTGKPKVNFIGYS